MSTAWPEVTLEEHCDLLSGFAFKSKQFTDDPGDVPLIKGENVGKGEILWDKSKRWPANDANSYDRFWLQEDDVVLAMDRPIVSGELKFAWIKPHDPPSLLVQRVARLRGANGISSRFLRCLIASPQFKSYIDTIITGVNVPHISGRDIKRFSFGLPPIDTQERIVEVLSSYDGLIENNRRRIALLEEAAGQLYKEWFVRLRFPGHEHTRITNGLPDGWDEATINDLLKTESGFAFKSKTFVASAKYRVVTIRHVKDGEFVANSDSQIEDVPPKMPRHCFLTSGDVLLSLTGNIGRACLVHGDDYLLNQRVAKLRPHDPSDRAFVYATFRQRLMQQRLEMISSGVAQQNLSPVKMGQLPFTIPKGSLRQQYAAVAEPICDEIVKLNLLSEKLAEARDLLLPRLMSGEVEV